MLPITAARKCLTDMDEVRRDCQMPRSARWLATTSLVFGHRALRQLTQIGLDLPYGGTVVVGPGRDGCLSTTHGFMPSVLAPDATLPSDWVAWDELSMRLPQLLRQGNQREAIALLPPVNVVNLPSAWLRHASVLVSSLAHAYFFFQGGHDLRDTDAVLPPGLEQAWTEVAARLGRAGVARLGADDILHNARPGNNGRLEVARPYFKSPEEDGSNGVQMRLEACFAPGLDALLSAQKAVLHRDDRLLMQALAHVASCIIDCDAVILDISPQLGCNAFDPIIWARTYVEMGRKLRPDELDNSGIDAPLFHALDAFFGHTSVAGDTDDLRQMQSNRQKRMPGTHAAFLATLREPACNVRTYAQAAAPVVRHAFAAALQIYHAFLERHRRKAVGGIGLVMAAGRNATAGGTRRCGPALQVPPDERVNTQLMTAMRARVALWPHQIPAQIDAMRTETKFFRIRLRFDFPVAVAPGDHVQVWPAGDHAPPRHYSVGKVSHDPQGQVRQITLTVSRIRAADRPSAGIDFWSRQKTGAMVSLRLTPTTPFRLRPGPHLPLMLVAQGSGIGVMLGFLAMRRSDRAQQGPVHLWLAARRLVDVVDLTHLRALSREMPLTVHLILSEAQNLELRMGQVQVAATQGRRVSDFITAQAQLLQPLNRAGAHWYVCGSVDFGHGVRTAVTAAVGDAAVAWRSHYHEDLFSAVTTSGERPTYRLEQVAAHNRPDDLWTIINGQIYDLSPYVKLHPGGLKMLMESAGTVADRRFMQIHGGSHRQQIEVNMAPYQIGRLDPYDHQVLQCSALGQIQAQDLRGVLSALDLVIRGQNVLFNSTRFDVRRNVPFFVSAQQLDVFCRDTLVEVIAGLCETQTQADDRAQTRLYAEAAETQATLANFERAAQAWLACRPLPPDEDVDPAEAWLKRLRGALLAHCDRLLQHCKDHLGDMAACVRRQDWGQARTLRQAALAMLQKDMAMLRATGNNQRRILGADDAAT